MKIHMLSRGRTARSAALILSLLVAVSLLLVGCGRRENDEFATAAEIDGIPVALGELEMFIEEEKQLAASHFKNTYGLDALTGDDWFRDFDGETPAGYAIDLALRDLIPYKLVQQSLKELGEPDDISYKAFIEKWEDENRDRAEKKKNGEVIYGPVQYTKRVYYDYLHDERLALLERLTDVPAPQEPELLKIYDDNADMFLTFGRVTMRCFVIPQSELTEEDVRQKHAQLKQALSGGTDITEASSACGLSDYGESRTFTAEDLGSPDITEFPEVSDAVYNLPSGGLSDVIVNGGYQYIFFYCESREGGGRRDFESCTGELEQIYREEYFERQLNERIDSAKITLHQDVLARIAF